MASLYYQNANKAKDGKGSDKKEPSRPSTVLRSSANGMNSTSSSRTSFAGVGQASGPAGGHDEEAAESAALLPRAGS